MAAGARLDNRAELLQAFAVPVSEQAETRDERLVLEACARWGEDAPLHLLGAWVFAAWATR